MARNDGVDLMLTEDGDLFIEKGDLKLVRKQDFITQSARNRLKITDPEWVDHEVDEIGANLEDLAGMPNNPTTARLGIDKIVRCLTKDGLIDSSDVYVRPVPVSRYMIVFYVFIRVPDAEKTVGFEVVFNLESGLTVRGA